MNTLKTRVRHIQTSSWLFHYILLLSLLLRLFTSIASAWWNYYIMVCCCMSVPNFLFSQVMLGACNWQW